MKRSFISDWWKVFKFTIKQGISSKGFMIVTVLLAVGTLVAGILINIGMAHSEKNESDIYKIEKCYVINSSDLTAINPEGMLEVYKDNYPDMYFEQYEGKVEELAEQIASEIKYDDEGEIINTKDVVLEVVNDENDDENEENQVKAYLVKVYIPHDSEVSDEEAEQLGEDFALVVQQGKMLSLDVPIENQVLALSQVDVEYVVAGEEKGDDAFLLRFTVSTVIILFLFMLFVAYGQSMGTVVSIEKSSKLMEYILTIVGPQGLIFGKITGMAVIAITQLLLWIVMFIIGFVVGDPIAKELIYSEYSNEILQIIDAIRKTEGAALAFTPGAIIMMIISICLAILFFFMFAGLVSSFISKADELQNAYAIYQMFMMLGFFGGYLTPTFGVNSITTIVRFIPFCGAFMLPGDILNGDITLLEGVGHMGLLTVWIALLVYLTGKVYKDQLFYRGKEGKMALVVNKIFGR